MITVSHGVILNYSGSYRKNMKKGDDIMQFYQSDPSEKNSTDSEIHAHRKIYHAALYARRRFTDLVQPDEPDPSAAEQIRAMKEYLADLQDISADGIYMDGRKIRPTTLRPQFQKLLLDIQAGNYNCIVMYSLDTFGRDINENRYYVLRRFTALGLRIISLLDGYDSYVSEPSPGTFSRLEEIIKLNMRFDKSRKRTAIAREYGKKGLVLIKKNVPYGYRVSPDEDAKLVVDQEVAPYIRYIFEQYASGTGPAEIARNLTSMKAPCPTMRKSQLGVQYKKTTPNDYWASGSISGILRNQIYTGDFIYGTDKRSIYIHRDQEQQHRISEKQIIRDHHEPIISRELFDQVQKRIEQNRPQRQTDNQRNSDFSSFSASPFRKQLFCGLCGRPMYFYHDSRVQRCEYTVYVCYSRPRKLKNPCSYDPIKLSDIVPAVKESLLQERRLALEIYRQMEDGTDSEIYQSLEKYFQDKIDALVEAGKRNNAELSSVLEDAPEQRAELLKKETRLREELVEAINRKKTFRQTFKTTNSWLVLYSQLPESFDITLEIARKYVYRIYLYPDAPAKFQPMKQEAKSSLLGYYNLIPNIGLTKL